MNHFPPLRADFTSTVLYVTVYVHLSQQSRL